MCPDSMSLGSMVPIPKCKLKALENSDNYRSIALSSNFGKLLDWVILLKEQKTLSRSDAQFGFKEKSSTTQCTFVFLETVNYYNSHGSNCYSMLLDATKAFDRVQYCKLFKELINRGMPPTVVRLLLYMYTNQRLQVKWGTATSNSFAVSNGVKQGGVLSPILFLVYIDGLLTRLKHNGIGCHVGHQYVGCLAFADNLTLLAPTLQALQKLISICEDYAKEFNVTFNGSKSQFLVFKGKGCKVDNTSIVVNGTELSNVTSADHLGHRVSTIDKASLEADALCKFWKSYNLFMADFGHIKSSVKCKLFKTYCCSFYGASLWPLHSNGVYNVCVAWRKALRYIWGVPYTTHKYLVAMLTGSAPLEICFEKRFMKFYLQCSNSKSALLKGVSKIAVLTHSQIFVIIIIMLCTSIKCMVKLMLRIY